jgi:hypothetical protein
MFFEEHKIYMAVGGKQTVGDSEINQLLDDIKDLQLCLCSKLWTNLLKRMYLVLTRRPLI